MDKKQRQLEYLKKLGIKTVEQAIEFDKKLVLNIGTLGCRYTKEDIEKNRYLYKEEK